jgi:hypothetical protein
MMNHFTPKFRNEKSAINRAFAEYGSMYATDVEVAATSWTEPAIAILPHQMIILKTRADVVNFLSSSLVRLKSLNYSHTESTRSEIKMLNASTALYAVAMNRMKSDGTFLEEAGATYVFQKIDGEWKICTGIVTDPGCV